MSNDNPSAEPKCRHYDIDNNGFCRDCGARAAISLDLPSRQAVEFVPTPRGDHRACAEQTAGKPFDSWQQEKLANPALAARYLAGVSQEAPERFVAALHNVIRAQQPVAEQTAGARAALVEEIVTRHGAVYVDGWGFMTTSEHLEQAVREALDAGAAHLAQQNEALKAAESLLADAVIILETLWDARMTMGTITSTKPTIDAIRAYQKARQH